MKQAFGSIKNYDWGKKGSDSFIYKLVDSPYSNVPYAELWMGTHTSGSCDILEKDKKININEFLQANPSFLGCAKDFETAPLPFLFKILSISKPLSIQVHPNKTEAEQLNQAQPKIYRDANHKPEMAVALTKFEALIGLRNYKAISFILTHLHPLQSCIDTDLFRRLNYDCFAEDENSMELIKKLFAGFFQMSPDQIKSVTKGLKEFIKTYDHTIEVNKPTDVSVQEIFHVFNVLILNHGESDVGCIVGLFLNYILLDPHEGVFLKAKTIHAYLSGDCVECMACSDNVIRAGLTTKFKDCETLLKVMDFGYENVESYRVIVEMDNLKTASADKCIIQRRYNVGLEEFVVESFETTDFVGSFRLNPIGSASFIIVLEGAGTFENESEDIKMDFTQGTIIFSRAMEEVCVCVTENQKKMLFYRATSNQTKSV